MVGSISNPSIITCATPIVSISASASGGNPPYFYKWSTNETTSSISVNKEDPYQVIISDNSGCYVAQSVRVVGACVSPISATTTTTPAICFNGNTGTATVTASGGSNYTYRWSNGQTTKTATRLLAGTYSVTVTSGNQTAVAQATVLQPSSVLVGSISNPSIITCATPIVSISASASGGNPPYFYKWSTNETTNAISVNKEGPYQVIISDNSGCYVAQSVRVIDSTPTKPTLTIFDNILPSFAGTISATGCGAGTVIEYSVHTEGAYSTQQPSYQTTPITVFARCRNLTTGCVSPSVTKTTAPTQLSSVITMSCPATISRTAPANTRSMIVTYPLPTAVSTCTRGEVNMALTQGLASGSTFPLGVTTVCYTAVDACTSVKNCCFNVNVYTSSNIAPRSVNSILFPNPANNQVNLTYEFPTRTDMTVEVKAASGQVIERHILRGVTEGRLDIQTETWDNGIYFVTIQNETKIETKKLLILH